MSDAPSGEFAEMIAMFEAAAFPVMCDPAVWSEEAARVDAPPLPWPLRQDGKGYEGMLRLYARELVVEALLATGGALGVQAIPTNPETPAFQLVLRVMKRAVDAGDTALRNGPLAGAGRVGDKMAWKSWHKARLVDGAIRSGLPRGEAMDILARLGISRATAYRALNRPRK